MILLLSGKSGTHLEVLKLKLWIDDIRPAPEGYVWCKSVNIAKAEIRYVEAAVYFGEHDSIKLIDIDHDAGDFASDGGDYIRLLDWLEETGRSYPIRIHSANSVGVANMRRIIQKNNWEEVF